MLRSGPSFPARSPLVQAVQPGTLMDGRSLHLPTPGSGLNAPQAVAYQVCSLVNDCQLCNDRLSWLHLRRVMTLL